MRALRVSGALLVVVVVAAWTIGASEMAARWGGGPVVIRPFMAVWSAVVSLAHALPLAALAWSARAVGATRVARWLLFGAAASSLIMFAVSLSGGLGPFAPDAAVAWLLTVLVLAPTVLHAFGLWQLAADLGGPRRGLVALALAIVDLGVVGFALAACPRHVVATVHPTTTLAGLGPLVASSLLVTLARDRRPNLR
jgi:hypothetical protein